MGGNGYSSNNSGDGGEEGDHSEHGDNKFGNQYKLSSRSTHVSVWSMRILGNGPSGPKMSEDLGSLPIHLGIISASLKVCNSSTTTFLSF